MSQRPGSPHGVCGRGAGCCGGGQPLGVATDAGPLGEEGMRGPVLGRLRGKMLRIQGGRLNPVDASRRGRGSMSPSLTWPGAVAGHEAADPEQTGPHAVLVVLLAGAGCSLLPGHRTLPLLPTDLLLRLQELNDALQDLCLLYFWVL